MTDVEYVGDCNVAMLYLWTVLIYLSVLRVAYNFLMLLLAGLFSWCCSCCKRVYKDRIKETKGAGFGEDKDLGNSFLDTTYFATFAGESIDRLDDDDNVFEAKPSEMIKRKHRRDSCPPPSPPASNRRRRSSRRSSGTTRIDIDDSNMIAAVPSDLNLRPPTGIVEVPSGIRPPTGFVDVPSDVRPPIVELASMNMSLNIDKSFNMIPAVASDLNTRNIELGPMKSFDPETLDSDIASSSITSSSLSHDEKKKKKKKKKRDITSI